MPHGFDENGYWTTLDTREDVAAHEEAFAQDQAPNWLYITRISSILSALICIGGYGLIRFVILLINWAIQ